MALRHSLKLISVLLTIALIISCESPDLPELCDSYEDVLNGIFFVEKEWHGNTGSILVEINKITYRNIPTVDDEVVYEYYFSDNIFYKSISITRDEDGNKLKNKLESALWQGKSDESALVNGEKMYNRTYSGKSGYLFREYSIHFNAISLKEMTLLEQ